MDSNRVRVRIYGQEYTIIGDKDEEEIRAVAGYVDERMHAIGKSSFMGSSVSLAVLSAVNITDELMTERKEIQALNAKNEQLEQDTKKYVELWDEAKRNLIRYKAELEELRIRVNDDSSLKDLEAKYKELESSYFDLQMENIQLKSRLEKVEE